MNKEVKLSLTILLLLSLFKFWQLNGGVILAEPDERIYLEAAKSLSRSPFPYLSGIPFFYGLPLHTYLIFLLSKVFPDGYMAGRVLSVLASLGLTMVIYHHVRWKFGKKSALWSALFFLLCPFAIFYSRVGIIEMTVAAFSIGSLFAFDYGLTTNNRRHLFLAGLLLGAAVLCKYTALVVGVVEAAMVGVKAMEVIREERGNWRRWVKKLPWLAVGALILAAGMVLPVAWAFYQHSPMYFKVQTKKSLGLYDDFWKNFGGEPSGIGLYASLIPWWVSWPILVLGILGVIWVMGKDWRRSWPLLLTFGLFAWQIFTRAPFNIRYFFPLVPFLCIFSGVGLSLLRGFFARCKFPSYLFFLFSIFYFLLILPSSFIALQATNHHLVEEVGGYIYSQAGPNAWIFSNYWPNYFGQAARSERATWLANSAWETGAFVQTDRSALEILDKEGGWVVFEDLYSQTLVHPPERTEAWRVIREEYQPVKIIEDRSPNFPQFPSSKNRATIYKIPAK